MLFQHQRERKVVAGRECIVATLDDIARANARAHEVLGRGLDDMPPQTRRLLGLIQKMERQGLAPAPADAVASGGAASLSPRPWRRRELRAFTGWSDTALKVHLGRLVELEYVLTRRDPAHLQGQLYELLFDGDVTAAKPHLSGLLDVDELRRAEVANRSGQTTNRSGPQAERSGSGQPPVSGWSAPGQGSVSSSENAPENGASPAKTHDGGNADAA